MADNGIRHLGETWIDTVKNAGQLAGDLQHGAGPGQVLHDAARVGASLAEDAAVIKRSAQETAIDGHLLGVARTYAPDTPLGDIHGIKPDAGAHAEIHARVVYINGIWNDEHIQRGTMQKIADATGAEVIGLHNGTAILKTLDVVQCVEDKLDLGHNAAVDSMAKLIEESVRSGEPLNILAHSQGALITSRAVEHAIHDLHKSGMDADSIKDALTHVHIQSFGGAAYTYPDGPQYFHHVNTKDPVWEAFGYRPVAENLHTPGHGERDTSATAEHFHLTHAAAMGLQHSIDDTYMPHINPDMIQRYDTSETVEGHVIPPPTAGATHHPGPDHLPPTHAPDHFTPVPPDHSTPVPPDHHPAPWQTTHGPSPDLPSWDGHHGGSPNHYPGGNDHGPIFSPDHGPHFGPLHDPGPSFGHDHGGGFGPSHDPGFGGFNNDPGFGGHDHGSSWGDSGHSGGFGSDPGAFNND